MPGCIGIGIELVRKFAESFFTISPRSSLEIRLDLWTLYVVFCDIMCREADVTSSDRYDLVWSVPIKSIDILDPTLPSLYKPPVNTASKPMQGELFKLNCNLVIIIGDLYRRLH